MQDYRKKIDAIDQQIAALFNARFLIVEEIKAIKKQNNLPIHDKKREEALLRDNLAYIEERFRPYFTLFYKELLKQSKAYQK